MANADKNSLEGYYSAINWLAEHRPHMVSYISALGTPQNDRHTKRAMVVSGRDLAPKLYANNEFLLEIGPAMAAGVLVHEWRHVLLNHLGEALSPKPEWRLTPALDDAHEAIINDHLEISGYSLPKDVVRGSARGPHFYGYWTTDEAYGPMEEWYLSRQQKQDPPKPEEDEEESDRDDSQDQSNEDQDQKGSDEKNESDGNSSESSEESGDGDSEDAQDQDGSSGNDQSDSGSEPGAEGGEPSEGESQGQASSGGSSGGPSEESGEPSAESGGSAPESTDSKPESSASNTESQAAESEADADQGEDGAECGHKPMIEGEDGELRDMDEKEKSDFIDKLNEIVADAIRQTPMPDEEKPTEDELDNLDKDVAEAIDPDRADDYSKAGTTASAAEQILAGGKLHIGWLKLLQRINPNVGKEDGGIHNKASYNWARPRRTTSLIRGAHLPSYGAPRDSGAGTTLKPTVLIALDFSGSIDRRLANAMKDMAQSIPEEHIEAHCFTFSTEAVPFNFKASSNRTASGGTDFSCIELEARKIQKKTGQYPYVMCLTDGEAWFGFGGYYGNASTGASPSQEQLNSHWLWVDVNTEDDKAVFTGYGVDSRLRQQINLSALPYDRSKL